MLINLLFSDNFNFVFNPNKKEWMKKRMDKKRMDENKKWTTNWFSATYTISWATAWASTSILSDSLISSTDKSDA